MTTTVLLGLTVLLILIPIIIYNSLINRKNSVDYALSSIDVMLKKRRELIPNLVATVKQYASHEKALLENIVRLRNTAVSGEAGSKEQFEIEGQISQTLRQIMVVVENYPNLKANQNFLQLQAALNETEEQISASRRAYNGAVLGYNNSLEMFPSNLFANAMNYKRKQSFEIAPQERENVDISQLFNN